MQVWIPKPRRAHFYQARFFTIFWVLDSFQHLLWKPQKKIKNLESSSGGPYTTPHRPQSLSLVHVTRTKLFWGLFGCPGKSYPAACFLHFQKKAPRRCPKWPVGVTKTRKSSKCGNFVKNRFARLNLLKKPVFWIYGSGGCMAWYGAQKC